MVRVAPEWSVGVAFAKLRSWGFSAPPLSLYVEKGPGVVADMYELRGSLPWLRDKGSEEMSADDVPMRADV